MNIYRQAIAITVVFAMARVLANDTPAPAEAKARDSGSDYQMALKELGLGKAGVYEVEGNDFALLPEKRLLVVTRNYVTVKGFKGPSVLAIMLGEEGKVQQVVLLDTPDTPAYVQRVTRRLAELTKQSLDSRERPVVAVTGATRSAQGITDTVNQTLDRFAPLFKRLSLTGSSILFDGKELAPKTHIEVK